jgi:hypothetical protein
MKWMKPLLALLLIIPAASHAQESLSQTIKGTVVDADSRKGLGGAAISIPALNRGTITDTAGVFKLSKIPVGRHTVLVSLLGYEERSIAEVMLTSGKEAALVIQLNEKVHQLADVKVTLRKSRIKPLNEFATLSARQFSVEDTKRYPAAAYDPARMAMNFAGVASNGDGNNEIVVRGNSPKGVLWRLEGIEIPNPNHFGALGNSGGPISMLSSSTLGNSDFYTGAFPAEIGNATSGAFDLKFREGNTDKREHSVMIGAMGLEVASEGPFNKGSKSSYLINYRYSTLALLKGFLSNLGGILPEYQDISFKLNFPTHKAGTFSLFGLGGYNRSSKDPAKDSTKWHDDNPNFYLDGRGKTGVIGLSHQYFLTKASYLKTIVSASGNSYRETVDTLMPHLNYDRAHVGRISTTDVAYRASVLYNNKLNNKNTFRAGVVATHMSFNFYQRFFNDFDKTWKEEMNSKGNTQYLQGFAQWKHRFTSRLSAITGLHGSYFMLNETYTVEPRAAITYSAPKSQTLSIAAGVHAKPEHLSTYFFKPDENNTGTAFPNKQLEIPKALHFVAGYEKSLVSGWRMKAEAYYQYLYDVPVEKADSKFSMVNAASVMDLYNSTPLVSAGKATNYGLDVTVEKPFSNNYFVLLTGSLFESKYTNYSGKTFNSRYNRNYQTNLVAGKEWKVGEHKNNIIGLNAKLNTTGGLRQSPIDLEASRKSGNTEYVKDEYYTNKGGMYYRMDVGFSYKRNRKHSTHTISFDIQNVTNHRNLFYEFYDNKKEKVKKVYQMGVFPVINYRIEFSNFR